VTHPVATRHFVTFGEVARRAIQAAAVGGADEVLVRDPSEPAQINDFAKQEAGRPGGPDVEIVPAGLSTARGAVVTADAVPARRRVGIATDRRNILVLSAGRRVELVQQFQAAARELLPGSLVLAGASPELSAACQIADRSVRLPRVSDAAYRAELVAVCRSQSVGLIVPTTDTELLALASLRDVLEADGTAACVSDSSLVATCRDKRVTGDVLAPWISRTRPSMTSTH
jgi:hypothetical protein